MQISFTIPGAPKGKARARTVRGKNGGVHSFTPEDTVNYENLVKMCFNERKPGGWVPYEGIVKMTTVIYFPIPKSASKKKREQMLVGEIRPLVKPDCSNVVKSIEDALNGIAYIDDSQIVYSTQTKYYSETPEVRVVMEFR